MDTRASSVKPLAEVKERIVQTLKQRQARDRALSTGEQLLADMHQDGNWESLLSDSGLEPKQTTQTRLEPDSQPPLRVTTEVFRTPAPKAEPVYGGVSLNDGSYVLFRLTDVADGEPAGAEDNTRQEINSLLNNRRGGEYFLSYQRGLRESADVEIFEENL